MLKSKAIFFEVNIVLKVISAKALIFPNVETKYSQ